MRLHFCVTSLKGILTFFCNSGASEHAPVADTGGCCAFFIDRGCGLNPNTRVICENETRIE
ncbi:hypothetical protein Rcae01_03912 [Novipirellula caenicola]|uniref:Uncharacterized protein n=1 Tax=Novipirellula caenicola TaxID=1536901 RepID=A0ABP9VUS7_9BACT